MYRRFWLDTVSFKHPARFGYDWFCSAIDKINSEPRNTVDWLDYEMMARDILNTALLTDTQKVGLLRDALQVYTLR